MSASILAVVPPPTEMTTPQTVQTVATAIIGAVLGLMVLGALILWRRAGSPAALLVLLGGFICSFNEEMVDILGLCYFPKDGWTVHEMWGRPIPLWVVLAYSAFFGGLTYLSVLALQRGLSYRGMWLAIGGVWVADILIEIPTLASDLYTYYGDQTYQIAGFPLNWLLINGLGSLLAAVIIHRFSWALTGVRQLLLLVIPFASYLSSWAVAMPHFAALNSDVPEPVRWIGSTVAIGAGLFAMHCLIQIGVGRWNPSIDPRTSSAPREPEAIQPDRLPALHT